VFNHEYSFHSRSRSYRTHHRADAGRRANLIDDVIHDDKADDGQQLKNDDEEKVVDEISAQSQGRPGSIDQPGRTELQRFERNRTLGGPRTGFSTRCLEWSSVGKFPPPAIRARSSVGEHHIDTVGVRSSILLVPTIFEALRNQGFFFCFAPQAARAPDDSAEKRPTGRPETANNSLPSRAA
jgi:hypothetical protein